MARWAGTNSDAYSAHIRHGFFRFPRMAPSNPPQPLNLDLARRLAGGYSTPFPPMILPSSTRG